MHTQRPHAARMQLQPGLRSGVPVCTRAVVRRASTCRDRLSCKAALVMDSSARVKGSLRQVFQYVADYSNMDKWHPGVTSIRVTRGAGKPLSLRHQFEIEQTISTFKIPTLYEVVDMQLDKKVVYSAGSDLHHATEQLVFMPDPNDPTFTVVRYMQHVELTEWRKALQPVVSGVLKGVPDKAMRQLTNLLNSSQSPIQAEDPRSARRGGGGGSSGTQWGGFSNLFNGMRGGTGTTSTSRGGSSSHFQAPSGRVQQVVQQVDALGYYAVLGLDAKKVRSLDTEDIKKAFRRAAQSMHPDKLSAQTDSEEERVEVEDAFKKVQRAYEVLRSPTTRKLYDAGKLEELEESLML